MKKCKSAQEIQEVKFISPEDLILSKLLWYKESQSALQIEDIKSILKISKVDLKYIKTFDQAINNQKWDKEILVYSR